MIHRTSEMHLAFDTSPVFKFQLVCKARSERDRKSNDLSGDSQSSDESSEFEVWRFVKRRTLDKKFGLSVVEILQHRTLQWPQATMQILAGLLHP